jgi:hypothetical protein
MFKCSNVRVQVLECSGVEVIEIKSKPINAQSRC